MGREIRRVPPNWEHPRYEPGERYDSRGEDYATHYKPLYDESFEDAVVKWMGEATAWVAVVNAGGTPEHWYADTEEEAAWARANPFKAYALWWSSPPDPESYRDRFTEEPTAYQIYETVSEGTPISPVCATEDDLITWMMGDHPRWPALSEAAARRFIRAGSAPSIVMSPDFGMVQGAQIFEHTDPSR